MINASGIDGGGLKSYCKTRWTTSSESVNSVIRLKVILQDVSIIKNKQLSNSKLTILFSSQQTFLLTLRRKESIQLLEAVIFFPPWRLVFRTSRLERSQRR